MVPQDDIVLIPYKSSNNSVPLFLVVEVLLQVLAAFLAHRVDDFHRALLHPGVFVLEQLTEKGQRLWHEYQVLLLEGCTDGHDGFEGGAPAVSVV